MYICVYCVYTVIRSLRLEVERETRDCVDRGVVSIFHGKARVGEYRFFLMVGRDGVDE